MRRAAAVFFKAHIERHIFPEMRELIAELQRRGVDIWAVSSTNDWVIEEGVKRFDIPANRVLSTRVQVVDGLVTDRILDVPTDEGKVTALARMGVGIEMQRPDAVFGNSVHDAAMLGDCAAPIPGESDAALAERSAFESWPVYFPAAVAPR